MGSLCDFCGGQRSMVYCKSDAASLCLSCDRNVHSANALSRRHSRALLCDRCYSQPATVRCIEEHISLCQDCDWKGHGNSTSSSGHKRQAIRSYSGCPSATELARIWSFVLEFPPITDCSSEQGITGLMSINENSTCTYWGPLQQSNTADMADICGMNDVEKVNTTNVQIASSTGTATPMTCSADQQADSIDSTTPKSSDDGRMKKAGNSEDDFYDGFAVDDELTFRNYEELFGATHEHSEDLFDDLGIDSIFEMENSAASSNYHGEFAAEASSASQVKSMQVESNNAISADSVMPNQVGKTGCNISISARQAHSSLSHTFSSLTGESSAGDYEDYGMPSMLFMGEPPWCPTSSDISIQATNRDNAVMRYKEKKKARKFEKKIRYASRKTRADSRRRVKGRFVKAGEAFDYDPLSQTRSF